MKATFENATLKIWFQGLSTSRNIDNVVSIEKVEDAMVITDKDDNAVFINFRNVNLIEEI
jgi:hypothetical protein